MVILISVKPIIMKTMLIFLFFVGINVSSQYTYHNFEYSRDYYVELQKKTDYNKISDFIISKINPTILTSKFLFIPFYLPECGSCDEARETTQSEVINEISYLNFWNEKTFTKFLTKFSNKSVIITSDYYGTGNEPIEKEIINKFAYLNKLQKNIGIRNHNGRKEEIYIFNNKDKQIIINDEDIVNSNFLLVKLKPYHNNVNGREKQLKTNKNSLIIIISYIIDGNYYEIQKFIYDYDKKDIKIMTQMDYDNFIYSSRN